MSTSSSDDGELRQIASTGATLAREVELVLSVVLRGMLLDIILTAGSLLIDTILRKVPLGRLRALSSVAKSRFCTVIRKSGAINNTQ